MAIPVISPLLELADSVIDGVVGLLKGKQEIKKASNQHRAKLAESDQTHNQIWELKQLENAGWKDDVLFYAIIAMYVYSAIDPDGAAEVFKRWDELPDWWITITGWMVAAVLGIKKLGDYLPGLIRGIRTAIKN